MDSAALLAYLRLEEGQGSPPPGQAVHRGSHAPGSSAPPSAGGTEYPDTGDSCPFADPPNFSGDPTKDAQLLSEMFEWYSQHPNNLQIQKVLLESIISLNNSGELTNDPSNPLYQAFVTQVDPSGSNDPATDLNLIENYMNSLITTPANLLFFQDGGDIGPNGVGGWLASVSGSITGGGFFGTYLQGFIDNTMPTQMQYFYDDHYNNGDLIWTIVMPDGSTQTYHWNDPNGQSVIMKHIRNLNHDFWDNYFNADGNGFNEMTAAYRKAKIDDLFARYGVNNVFLIIMLIMAGGVLSYDNQYNTQMGGETQTTKDDTEFTNLLQELSKEFGNVGSSQFDGMNFMDQLNLITAEMNDTASMSGIAGQFNSQTFSAFMNQQVTFTPSGSTTPITATLGSVFQGVQSGTYQASDMSAALNSLVAAASGGAESPGYRALLDAMTAGGGLVTQQSKAVSTQSTALAQLLNSVDNLGDLVADPTKTNSYMYFINQIIQAFISK